MSLILHLVRADVRRFAIPIALWIAVTIGGTIMDGVGPSVTAHSGWSAAVHPHDADRLAGSDRTWSHTRCTGRPAASGRRQQRLWDDAPGHAKAAARVQAPYCWASLVVGVPAAVRRGPDDPARDLGWSYAQRPHRSLVGPRDRRSRTADGVRFADDVAGTIRTADRGGAGCCKASG